MVIADQAKASKQTKKYFFFKEKEHDFEFYKNALFKKNCAPHFWSKNLFQKWIIYL